MKDLLKTSRSWHFPKCQMALKTPTLYPICKTSRTEGINFWPVISLITRQPVVQAVMLTGIHCHPVTHLQSWYSIGRSLAHYSDVIMSGMASLIIGVSKTSKLRVTIFVRGIRQWQVNFPHKGPVTRKMFPFHDVIMARFMVTPRHGNIFHITNSMWVESTARFPSQSVSYMGL